MSDHGIAVSTPVGCFLELARELALVDLVILGDSMVKRRKITLDKLRERSAAYRGPGARMAREAARLVGAGVDSSMETRLRLLLIFAGLPEPAVDLRLCDDKGELRRRLDLAYEVFDCSGFTATQQLPSSESSAPCVTPAGPALVGRDRTGGSISPEMLAFSDQDVRSA